MNASFLLRTAAALNLVFLAGHTYGVFASPSRGPGERTLYGAMRAYRFLAMGSLRLPRPFKLLRLGHFGVNVLEPEAARDFYCRLLGFRVSDPIDMDARLPQGERGKHGAGTGYFTRHGGDHHSFVLFPRRVMT